MVNPIRNGAEGIRESASIPSIQQSRGSQGLAGIQSTIDQEMSQDSCIQVLCIFFQKIYARFISILASCLHALKRVFCGCLKPPRAFYRDEISNQLAQFHNPEVTGRVHGIYIVTNETNLESARQLFRENPRPSPEVKTIHIGCAGWHNLDLIATRKSTYGLVIDFNPKNAEFIHKTIELIDSCESREGFKRAMIDYLNSLNGVERGLFFHADQQELPTHRIERELSREGSWLQSDESYSFVKRELIAKGRLIPITEDIRNVEKMAQIRECLDRNGIAIDTLYMSNICNFMSTSNDRNAFAQSIKRLLHNDSIWISCPKIIQPDSHEVILSQKAILGREVLEESFNALRLFEEVASRQALI